MSAPKYQSGTLKVQNIRGRYGGQNNLGSNPNVAQINFEYDPYSQNEGASTAVGHNHTLSYPENSNVQV